MWASGRCQALSVLEPGDVEDQRIKVLLQRLSTRGTLSCYNISFLKGAHVLFVVYRARSESDFVQFACGACTALTWQSALAKALTEVWQTSILLPQMEFFDTTEYGGTELKEAFRKPIAGTSCPSASQSGYYRNKQPNNSVDASGHPSRHRVLCARIEILLELMSSPRNYLSFGAQCARKRCNP